MDKVWDGAERRNTSWHLKKEVPIATILTILFSIGTGSYWLMNLRTDIDLVRRDLAAHERLDDRRETLQEHTGQAVLAELRELRKELTSLKVSLAENGYRRDKGDGK